MVLKTTIKMKKSIIILLLFIRLSGFSQDINNEPVKVDSTSFIKNFIKKNKSEDKSLKIGGHYMVSYYYENEDGKTDNYFKLKRGYISLTKKFTDYFSAKITPDISLDNEGDGLGDIELRLKYLYGQFHLPDFLFFKEPDIKFGLNPRPWLGYEQKINAYKVQGKMYIEKYKIINSTDLGLTFSTLLGGKLDDDYLKNVNKNYAGKYGSLSFGIYNGGGYHAVETNDNKTMEWRLSLRPLHQIIPGLQFTYYGAYGKGNISSEPNFDMHSGYISYESKNLAVAAQYYYGHGNSSGSLLDTITGVVSENAGMSFFYEFRVPKYKFAQFARIDYFNKHLYLENHQKTCLIAGLSYKFYKKSQFIFSYETLLDEDYQFTDNYILQLALEIKF